jgi:hypothetical protein
MILRIGCYSRVSEGSVMGSLDPISKNVLNEKMRSLFK